MDTDEIRFVYQRDGRHILMADVKSKEARSYNMSQIKSRNTKPEVYLRKKLFSAGLRYRLYSDAIPGHPDLWLKKYNTAIFVHGCYWHRHPGCRYAYTPKSNIEFWDEKFQKNIRRDQKVLMELRENGIRVLIIWECTVRRMMHATEQEKLVMKEVAQFLRSNDPFMEL